MIMFYAQHKNLNSFVALSMLHFYNYLHAKCHFGATDGAIGIERCVLILSSSTDGATYSERCLVILCFSTDGATCIGKF